MHSKSFIHLSRLLTISVLSVVLTACFGDGDGPQKIPGTPSPGDPGKFLDPEVSGASYQSGLSGLTGILGEYVQEAFGTVTFFVGNIDLGTAPATDFVTPVELAGSQDPTDPAAVNRMVFVQSLDADQPNSANGIQISEATRAQAEFETLDFDSPTFAMDVVDVVNNITTGNMVVTEQDALDAFYETYKKYGGSLTFDWPFTGQAPFPDPTGALQSYNIVPPLTQVNADGGFEPPGTVGICFLGTTLPNSSWGCFNNNSVVVATGSSSGPVSHDLGGTQSLKVFGDESGAVNSVDSQEDDIVELTVWAMNWEGDPFNNRALILLTFWDGPGGGENTGHNQIGAEILTIVDTGGNGDVDLSAVQDGADVTDWTRIPVSAIAPAGTQSVQVLLLHQLVAGTPNSGSIFFDDVRLTSTPPPEFVEVWRDDFDNPAFLPVFWKAEIGYGDNGWGNNEWQYYTDDPANLAVTGGNLVITADCPTAPSCGVRNMTVFSARVKTQDSIVEKLFKYGKIRARIKPPVGKGAWPAFWMLGANFPVVGWPRSGEIDIMEVFTTGGSTANDAHFAMHWCDETIQAPATCSFPDGRVFVTGEKTLDTSLGDDFHIFEVEWDANTITGRVDDEDYFTQQIDPLVMEEFRREFYLILNVAMGGTLGSAEQPPDGTETWPQVMMVDWVEVLQCNPSELVNCESY